MMTRVFYIAAHNVTGTVGFLVRMCCDPYFWRRDGLRRDLCLGACAWYMSTFHTSD